MVRCLGRNKDLVGVEFSKGFALELQDWLDVQKAVRSYPTAMRCSLGRGQGKRCAKDGTQQELWRRGRHPQEDDMV
ncbi:MAG: hypothetical protein Q9181_004489 [Wetmoreana brouardii]